MGLDKIQSTVQLSPTCCHDRKENNLHAWWHWKVNKHCGANWETWKAYYNGCWVHYPHGPPMVLGDPFIVFFTFIYNTTTNTYFLCKCRSDPTENDSVEGLRPNARGPGLVTFGVLHDYSVAVEFLMFAFSYYFIKCLPFQIKYYVGSSFLNNQSYRWLCWSNLFPVKFSAWSSNRVL